MSQHSRGFTLIELSIVLVIIGLVVGGVLVGRDLISAAGVRAQISQIEKYQQAVNTFRGKYGYLPGDIPDPDATRFGFIARGQYGGEGDGNGIIESNTDNISATPYGYYQGRGETVTFWVDLSTAKLIDGSFTMASQTVAPAANVTGTNLGRYLPTASIGQGNYLYIFSGGSYPSVNFLGLSAATGISINTCHWCLASDVGLTVVQAYSMDKKVDDGLPQAGRVMAFHLSYTGGVQTPVWVGANQGGYPSTLATSGSSTTCYDNSNTAGTAQQYSITQNNGMGVNCALSFRLR